LHPLEKRRLITAHTQGKTLGGLRLTPERNVLSREAALQLWTEGSAWFSGEAEVKGTLRPGSYADLAVLSDDYLTVPGEAIQHITAEMTMTGGRIVHAEGSFADKAPPLPPISPTWSPIARFGGHWRQANAASGANVHAHATHEDCRDACALHGHDRQIAWTSPIPVSDDRAFWGALGCSCFAF
jgi:hypothetical protein